MRKEKTAKEKCYVCGRLAAQERVLVDTRTAAELSRVSRTTILRWARDGRLECGPAPRGHVRIYLDSLFTDPPFREFDLPKKRVH
jgi:excisionase family DNA binding protein